MAQSPWAYLVSCPESIIDNFVYSAPRDDLVVARLIRGGRCPTTKALFQECAAALQFPYYFGENWDAFEECITDLQWLTGRYCALFLTHTDAVLRDEEDNFQTLVAILRAADESARRSELRGVGQRVAVALRIVFHCDPGCEAATLSRFERAPTNTAELRFWKIR